MRPIQGSNSFRDHIEQEKYDLVVLEQQSLLLFTIELVAHLHINIYTHFKTTHCQTCVNNL